MKKERNFLLMTLLLFAGLVMLIGMGKVQAQSVTNSTFSAGGSQRNILSFTIGQIGNTSVQNDSLSLSQGIHQGDYQIVTGIFNIQAQSIAFKAFPNPFQDFLNIDIQENIHDSEIQYALIDVLGRTMSSGNLSKGINRVETHSLPSGTYILRFIKASEDLKSVSIIKK
jgi:hypothetical protein